MTNYDYESIVSGSLVENEYIVYDSSKETEFPSMKDVYYVDGLVSSIENKIKYLITDGTKDKSKNYNITVLPGELKILPLELNITPLEQEAFVYNGVAENAVCLPSCFLFLLVSVLLACWSCHTTEF